MQPEAGCISQESSHHSCLEGSLDGLVAPLLGWKGRRSCCGVIAVTLHIWRVRVQSWLLRVYVWNSEGYRHASCESEKGWKCACEKAP